MRFALLALSALLLALAPAQPALEAGLPAAPKMTGHTALSGLLAAGYTIVGAVGTVIMLEHGSSVYLCASNFDTAGQVSEDHLKRLAAQLPAAVCAAVS